VVLKSLAEFSARWRHVEITHLSPTAGTEEFAEIIPPTLESFKFTGSASILSRLNIFQASGLRAVSLHSPGMESLDAFVLTMPRVWDQLTHLTLQVEGNEDGLSLPNVIVLLGRFKQLISFNVTPMETDNEVNDDGPSEPILLPLLETFILGEPGFLMPHSLSRLIERVSMPQLRQFHASALCSEGRDSYFLVPLGTRSPRINNLTIYLPSLTTESLPGTLRSFSSLTMLSVFDNYNGWANQWHDSLRPCDLAQFLTLLTPNADTAVCPILQELTITSSSDLPKSTLDAFLEGRMEFTPDFRSLRIVLQNSWVVGHVSEAEIQSYLSRGLDISFVYDSPWRQPTPSPWTGLSPENQ